MYLKRSVGFLLLSVNSAVFADNVYKPGEYYVAPGVAYYHFSEKREIQNAAMANVSAGLVVSDQFSLEAFYGQAATEETPVSTEDATRFHTYWADGVYHFNPSTEAAVHPYVLAGLGITNQNDDNASSGNTTLLGVNAGAGVEYFVNSNISLFTDVRDIYTLSGGKNDWMLNAGIKFLFGAKSNTELVPAPLTPVQTDGAVGFYELQENDQL
ncbi:MAG: outer membrane beta-barrel protein [Gammaproteobacteria bacterium]|nr:outer membrane beta-barrel protein [Gammaproteobacteria bacterium]